MNENNHPRYETGEKETALCFVNAWSDIYVSPVKWNGAALRRQVGRYKSGQIVIGQIKREIENAERSPGKTRAVLVFHSDEQRMGRGR